MTINQRTGRAALVGGALLAVVLVASLGLLFVGRMRLADSRERFAENTGPLQMSAYQLPEIPVERNAAHWLEAGADALVIDDGEMDGVRRLLDQPIGEISDEQREAARNLIDRNEAAFDLLGRSAGLVDSTFGVDYSRGLEAAIPSFLNLHNTARLVLADGRVALLSSDVERLTRDLAILDQMATTLTREPALICVLFGLAADRSLLLLVRDIVESGLAETGLIADLRQRLEDRDRTEALRRSFTAEGALVVNTPLAQLVGENESSWSRAGLVFFEPFQQAGLLDGWADLAAALDRPWLEIRSDFTIPPDGEPRAPWDVHHFMLPNILSAIDRLKANNSSALLARTALGLWASRLAGEEYPSALTFDSDDPYTGEPFRYELGEDGSAALEAAGAESLWRDSNPAGRAEGRPVFTWKLAPFRDRSAESP